ncbi:TraR/DksA C4-type zinc finger protein [Jatrophihabitans sp.]|uniref:TraR/DksA family transcriptional regulator n=1 Tax=Jatrophihabitans sp. TaxID=1932789 RepID=UPI0030C6CFBF|nr:DNA-binding protein [Jatrophihabitans sp.]
MTAQAKSEPEDQTEAIRSVLRAERATGESTLADLDAQLQALRSASVASNGDDEHDPEGSTIAFEAAQLETLRERAGEHLDEIDLAIERLDKGTYGICERCEQPIGAARLAALPAARLCVRCAGLRQ